MDFLIYNDLKSLSTVDSSARIYSYINYDDLKDIKLKEGNYISSVKGPLERISKEEQLKSHNLDHILSLTHHP